MQKAPLVYISEQDAAGLQTGRVFAGELLVFSGLSPVRELVERARSIVDKVFGCDCPEKTESRMSATEFQQAVRHGRRLVDSDEHIDDCWQETLTQTGMDPSQVYRDRVRLRVVPSSPALCNRIARPLDAHRDTWGSGIMAQINWWLPLYPLSPTRTMLVWPEYFARPLANTSADWNYETLLNDSGRTYPLLPVVSKTPAQPGMPVVIEPGDLLVFSAAHLHSGCSDGSGLTRFSLDTRCVWQHDIEAGRGAVNVDGETDRPHWEMFCRPGDNAAGSISGTAP